MSSALRHVVLIGVVATVVLFTNLGGPRLWDRDEPRNAGCTAEMFARGDLITPVFDDELRTHKPILLYWFMMTAYGLFGVSEFSARFWSAALAVGTTLLTYGIGRRLFSAQVGLWAGVALATTLMFGVAGRAATPDSLLIFWSTAAIFAYVYGTFPAVDAHSWSTGAVRWFPRWSVAMLMYGLMGLAVLAKGPVGLVLPTAVIGMYLLVQRLPEPVAERSGAGRVVGFLRRLLRPFAPRHFLGTCWLMRPITALTMVTVVALPWYVAVGLRTDGQWVSGFLLDHNLGRASQALEGHNGFWLFYPVALLVGFFPWSVFAAPTLLETVRRVRAGSGRAAGYVLATCWIGVYLGIFSLAHTKLPSYITPCYPAVAMLVASFLVAWMDGRARSASFWPAAAFSCLGLVGLGIACVVPWVAARYLPGEEWLSLLGCIPMLTAMAAVGFAQTGQSRRAVLAFRTGAVAITTALFALGAARVDAHRTFDGFIAQAFQRCEDPQIGTLGVLEPSWVFYSQRPLDHLFVPELSGLSRNTPMLGAAHTKDWQFKPFLNMWQYLAESPNRFVITTASQLQQLGPLPAHIQVVARTPYFLRGDEELVMLAPRNLVARQPEDNRPDSAAQPDSPAPRRR